MSWHVVCVETWRETRAMVRLTSLGVRCWLPLAKSREDQPAVALFPGYLFVDLQPDQAVERDPIRGIYGMLRMGDSLPEVPDDVMTELRARLAADGGVVILKKRNGYKKGQKLGITEGLLTDKWGLYVGSFEARNTLLLDIMATGMRVEVPADAVSAAQ